MRRSTERERKLRGNPGHRQSHQHATLEPLERLPRSPRYLSPTAKREWNLAGQQLVDARLLTRADLSTLEQYARLIAIVRDAESEMAGRLTVKSKRSAPRPHPNLRTICQASVLVLRYAAELGLSPKSRGGIEAAPAPAEPDPFEQFLRQGKRDVNSNPTRSSLQ
jgi:P27 family predicted phage terminase small subunit